MLNSVLNWDENQLQQLNFNLNFNFQLLKFKLSWDSVEF